jgi:hypothetical protein
VKCSIKDLFILITIFVRFMKKYLPCAVVIRWFSLNEAPVGIFKFISDYLPYFEKKNNIFFNIITKSLN